MANKLNLVVDEGTIHLQSIARTTRPAWDGYSVVIELYLPHGDEFAAPHFKGGTRHFNQLVAFGMSPYGKASINVWFTHEVSARDESPLMRDALNELLGEEVYNELTEKMLQVRRLCSDRRLWDGKIYLHALHAQEIADQLAREI